MAQRPRILEHVARSGAGPGLLAGAAGKGRTVGTGTEPGKARYARPPPLAFGLSRPSRFYHVVERRRGVELPRHPFGAAPNDREVRIAVDVIFLQRHPRQAGQLRHVGGVDDQLAAAELLAGGDEQRQSRDRVGRRTRHLQSILPESDG